MPARAHPGAGVDQAGGAVASRGPPGASLPARFISFRVVEDYRTVAFARGAEVPPSYAWARQVARRIERARGAFPERPCHNDLLNANFIDDGARIRIVDWEYAGMGDVFFDLANFSVNNGLGRGRAGRAPRGVLRRGSADHERALELMLFMSDFREAMWGVVQGAVSELDFDFAATPPSTSSAWRPRPRRRRSPARSVVGVPGPRRARPRPRSTV